MTESVSDATELRLINEERMSAQKCLQICAQLSDHINQIQLAPKRSGNSAGSTDPETLPERIVNEGLQECKNNLTITAAKLEGYMKDIISRLVAKSKTATTSEQDLWDLERLREEWETTRLCRDICSKADIHLRESVSDIENYATGDAVQFMVSTDGKTLHGKNRGLGWRTRQVGGHLNDISVQHLSRDMTSISLPNFGSWGPPSHGNTPPVPDAGMQNQPSSEFRERYGQGFKLTPKTTTDIADTGEMADGRRGSTPKR